MEQGVSTGYLNDYLERHDSALWYGRQLCIAVLANVWAASHYFLGATTPSKDLEETEALVISRSPSG